NHPVTYPHLPPFPTRRSSDLHIESQRRFHVAHGEKRHRLLYIRARHGFDRHRSPPSASRLIMKWKLWRCEISMSLIDFTEVSIGARRTETEIVAIWIGYRKLTQSPDLTRQ